MQQLYTPRRLPVSVPECDGEDKSPKFVLGDPVQDRLFRDYYQQNGYVIARGCFSAERCDRARALWEQEVKPYSGHIYRQATGLLERNVLNAQGWVMNPILNLQSIDPRRFPQLRAMATTEVLASIKLRDAFHLLLGQRPKVVQSMYFEGNSATWEHQDSYYLDSEAIGTMAAAWVALEDIDYDAGRFFVCPESHRLEFVRQQAGNNIADNHEAYIQQVVALIKEKNLEIRAPALRKGDVLFWNALTIHGSLDSQSRTKTRSSITCHAIAQNHAFLKYHTKKMDLPVDTVNGTQIFRPKDLARMKNRFIFLAERRFPKAFYGLRKMAIRRLVTSKKAGQG